MGSYTTDQYSHNLKKGARLFLLGDSVCEKTSDRGKLLVQIKPVFNINLLALGLGVLNDSNDHFVRILCKHGENIDA